MQASRTLQPTRVGEVVIRGAPVTHGYWADTKSTSSAIDSAGWLRTGDLGWFDSKGQLMLCGRRKDMIKSGGENIHASEVESALAAVVGVQEAAVVAVPHVRYGEAVAALLCVRPHAEAACGTSAQGAECSIWANVTGNMAGGWGVHELVVLEGDALALLQASLRRGGLTGFKVPQTVVVSQQPVPRTQTGKLDKRAVKIFLSKLTAPGESSEQAGAWLRSAL